MRSIEQDISPEQTVPTASRAARRLPAAWIIAGIVLLGAVMRFWNLGWDGGAFVLHPDELALNQVVQRLGPDLNPHFFYYGSFPIYLDRLTATLLGALTGVDWLAPARLPLIGRFYSALESTALIPLVFAVGRRVWGSGAGLLAAACTASAALLIQAAHFGTVDTLVTLAGLLLLWIALRILEGGGWRWYLLAGLVLGLAIATKLTAASFVILPALAHMLRPRREPAVETAPGEPAAAPRGYPPPARTGRLGAGWRGPLLLMGSAAVALLLAAPYYVLDWPEFWQAIVTQTDELSGGYQFSYTWQFIGSPPYLFELQNLVVWGLGLPLGLAALAGWAGLIADCGLRIADWRRARRTESPNSATRNTQHATRNTRYSGLRTRCLLLLWPLAYLIYIGTWEARFVRHLLPLVPWCALFAAGGIVALAGWLRKSGRGGTALTWAVGTAVVLGAVGWGLAVFDIYTTTEPRLAATAWIAGNVPAGKVIVVEDKNDLVPVPAIGPPLGTYPLKPLAVTAPDTPAKMGDFAAALATGDVLVVPNRRWSAVLPRLPAFPLTGQYYRLLFAGRLGYTPLATFADPPHLGPLAFPDDAAEETFQVFDHPTVRLFQNTGRLPEATLRTLLGAGP